MRAWERWTPGLMVLPALLGLMLFVALPFALAVGLAFTDLRLGSPLPVQFVGGAQFAELWGDAVFRRALLNNALFAAAVVPLQTAAALALALLLSQPVAGRSVFRALFFLPAVFPMALVAVVWTLIYAPGPTGMLNAALEALTLGAWEPRDFLHDTTWALPAIILMSIWQGVGFQMVILLAGLQGIPAQLYEAAALDGAGRWAQFLHVTLPGLRNPLIFTVLMTTILTFRLFDQVRIMTQGGPRYATTTLMYEAVKAAFERQQVARGAAITVMFFLIVLAVTALQRRWLRHERALRS